MPRGPRHWSSAQDYVYPEHLRPCLEGLPATPGVYIFHGAESEGLPLYIGKSTNIRQRVMSHFRTANESRMLQQARRVTYIETGGEIGALLLEARMIKQQQPLFNQRLRQTRQLCSLYLQDGLAEVVYARDMDFAHQPGLFGLFSSRTAALVALRELADSNRLCYGKVGLEKLALGRKCFRASIQQCAGACYGAESMAEHHARFHAALNELSVSCWPFSGAVGLVESHAELSQIHVVRNWCYLASVSNMKDAQQQAKVEPGFDIHGYKIIRRAIMNSTIKIINL